VRAVLELQPVLGPSRSVRHVDPLADNSFQAKLAHLIENQFSVALQVGHVLQTIPILPQELRKPALPFLERPVAEILTIEFKQIKGAQPHRFISRPFHKSSKLFANAVNDVIQQHLDRSQWATSFCPCAADPCLQVADYCTWAIQRKWERNDARSYNLIKDRISYEYELWERGTKPLLLKKM
jgi:hypothetical protein